MTVVIIHLKPSGILSCLQDDPNHQLYINQKYQSSYCNIDKRPLATCELYCIVAVVKRMDKDEVIATR